MSGKQRQRQSQPRQLADARPGMSGPSMSAAKSDATLGPNAGNLPTNMQTTTTAYGQWPAQQPSGKPYPDMPEVSDAKPLLQSIGATGTAIFAGIITSEEYNPDFYWRDAVKVYEQMLRSDGQVNGVRMEMELPLRRATWSIEPASDAPIDKEIASFVQSCLFDDMCYETTTGRVIRQKWDDILRHMLLSLWYGFSAFEVNWRIDDGWVKWARWTPLLPRTVWRWWVGEDNELTGIQQWTFKDYTYQFVNIPADKLLLFAHRQEGNNYEGVSLLRTAYKHWWYKVNYEKIEAIGIERNAVVPPVVWLPDNFTASDMQYGQQVAQNIRANELAGITMPPKSAGWDLEYPKNQQRYAVQVQPSIQYHDIMIARNALCQFINLGSTETGAYSLDKSQLATFRAALQSVAEYIEDVVNTDAIRRLVDYNYDGVAVYPKLKCSKIALQDLDGMAALLQQMQAFIAPSQELQDWLADELGIPSAPRSEIQTTNPGAPSTPDRPENANANDHTDAEPRQAQNGTDNSEPDDAAGGGDGGDGGDGGSDSGAGLSESRLLREALDAAYGLDAVERGLRFGGHAPGYTQNRNPHGQWAEGDGAGHATSTGAAKPKAGGKASGGKGARGGGSGKSSEGRVQEISVSQIHVGLNPREHFDQGRIDELAQSIKANGLLQPITVRPHENGYQIIAGERRFRAMQQIGMTKVPALVRDVDDAKARELAIVENINRADMLPTETAKAYQGLLERGMSVKEVATATGKSEAHVQQHLDLLTMQPHLQSLVDKEQLPMGVVKDMAKLSPAGQEEAATRIMQNDLGLRSARALVRTIRDRESQISMFPSVHAATKLELDAKAKYEDAIGKVTAELSRLDDETMSSFARVLDSPFRESERLDLMIKQLRRMQNALNYAGHARDGQGGTVAAHEQLDALRVVLAEALAAAEVLRLTEVRP